MKTPRLSVLAATAIVLATLAALPAEASHTAFHGRTLDSTCNGVHAYPLGTAARATVAGSIGPKALSVGTGSGNGAYLPSRPSTNLTRTWAESLWVRTPGTLATGTSYFVHGRASGSPSGTTAPAFDLWISTSAAATSIADFRGQVTYPGPNTVSAILTHTNLQAATWYHVVLQFGESGEGFRIWVDNVEGGSSGTSNQQMASGTSYIYLGRSPTDASPARGLYVDDWRMFNRVLTAAERTDLFNKAANPNADNPENMLWWLKFDEEDTTADPCAAPACPSVAWTATSTSVTLSWTDVAFERFYRVYRGDPPGTPVATLPVNSAGWADTGRDPVTTYKYRVVGANDTSESTGCNLVTATTTLPAQLPAPTGLSAVPDASGVTLTWTAVSGAASYKVYRSADAGANYVYLASAASATYRNTAVDNGQSYSYEVTALDAYAQESPYSSSATATVPYPPLLDAPIGFTLTTIANRVTASWNAVSGASAYNLYRSTNGGTTYVLLASLTATSYNDGNVQPATTYWYKVGAVDRWARAGAFTAAQSATPPLPDFLPAPTGLLVINTSAHATVSWDPVAGALVYNVYRSADAGATYAIVSVTDLTTIEDPNVAVDATYAYKVAAVDEYGREGTQAGPATTTIPPPPPLDPPRITLASSSRTVDVSWSVVAGAHGYRIYRGPNGEDVTLLATVADGEAGGYRDSAVALGNDYYYRVSVLDAYDQEGPKSDPVGITVSVTLNLQAFEPGPGSDFTVIADLSIATAPAERWMLIRGDLDVVEIRADAAGDGTFEHKHAGRDAQFLLRWIAPGNFRIQVTAYNAAGNVTHKEYPIKVQIAHFDPSTTPCTGRLCVGSAPQGQSIAERIGSIDPYFTPEDLWAWIVFLAAAALMVTVAYFKLVRG